MNIKRNSLARTNSEYFPKSNDISDYSAELARFHNWLGLKKSGRSLGPVIWEVSSFIKGSYPEINEYYYKTHDIIPSAEWYLDNYYLISELINELMKDLSKQVEAKLQYLAGGEYAGYPRIYVIVSEFMNSTENRLDFQQLKDFISSYQKEAPLSSAEIWAVPIMLKIILLEKISYHVERIVNIQNERIFAENWLNSVLGQNHREIYLKEQLDLKEELDLQQNFSTIFIEKAARRLKDYGADAKVLLHWLDNVAAKQNLTVEKVISSEQHYLTSHGVQMGNIISILKLINSENWSEFFEGVSLVQEILGNDPAGIFTKMDFESRDKYRHEIEELAGKYQVSELTVARTLEGIAAESTETPFNHIGYYLVGKGRDRLEKELISNWGKVRRSFQNMRFWYKQYPTFSYLGMILLLTLLPALLLITLPQGFAKVSLGAKTMFILAGLILINGIAVYMVNRFFCHFIKTSFLPKLDFREGIPADSKTIVVIPAIFSSPEKVQEQLRQLEIHYLSNKEDNLYFALLGDFCDAPDETMPGDEEIVQAGVQGVQKLNSKYQKSIFYFFHRARKWNPQEKSWMGWERKRGKLIEFNSLLLQDEETSYLIKSSQLDVLKSVRYVITLDADTLLPRDTARKLIGTIAHPLQMAQMDSREKKVALGYGIIQPRIGLAPSSAFKTAFSTMFTGTAGVDPYTCAVSDIYQDLFGEGIFTGKGIYDLKVFHSLTKGSFPENTILSHDLIEGLYTRTALATDIVLFDGYPTKYLSLTKRTHRWIRGDWQIARYLFHRDLSVISRWKIFDNLRRSLEAPMQLLLLFLAFTFGHGLFGWILGLVIFSLSLPLILNILGRIMDRSLTFRILKFELRLGMGQILFSLAVLPYQGYIQANAILRSIYRQTITKRSLLEWEPAADSERYLELRLKNFYLVMLPGLLISMLFLLGFMTVNLRTGILLTLFLGTWLISPNLAYRLSLPYEDPAEQLTPANRADLRQWARQVWAFFDIFVDHKNNYLPPDNVQLEPYKGAASRTSPTNIGLALLANLAARDLGYLSKNKMLQNVRQTMDTIRKMPKWNGHIYNWYNTETLEPLQPIYISTVDSGNLATYLIALKNGLKELAARPVLEKSILQGLEDTVSLIDFKSFTEWAMVEEFNQELKELRGKQDPSQEQLTEVKECYDFLSRWLERFKPYAGSIEEIKDKNISANHPQFWLSALTQMLADSKTEIAMLFPQVEYAELADDLDEQAGLSPRALIIHYQKMIKDHSLPQDLKETKQKINKQKLWQKGRNYLLQILLWSSKLQRDLQKLAYGMDFKPLFDFQKELFAIGYNLTEQKMDKSFYDLLASEARQTSLWAIAKGDVPESHWFKLSRPLTRINGRRSLVAWSGTMFEYLMPLILFHNYRGTLLDETYQSVVRIQQGHAAKFQAPWGISESGFFSYDNQTNYQYKAFGVPGLGLKRGLSKDLVISPYATFMALAVDPQTSMANLKVMERKGFNGVYGLYEAIDYTEARVPYNEKFSVVKSYMSHHQGMSFISLNNVLNSGIMQKRFHREPSIKSIELLLQEQVPLQEFTYNPNIEEVREETATNPVKKQGERPAVYLSPDTNVPRPCLLSNHDYAVMMTLSGSGYSQYHDLQISRWREDSTMDSYGSYIYIQNLNSGEVWSTTSKPLNDPGEEYKVTCFPNTVKYSRKDGNMLTKTEVFVAPEDPVEIRRVTLTNLSKYSRDIQLTSYLEVVLDPLKADMAHLAFSKLFIQTRYENGALVAFRRPRHHDKKKFFLMHTLFVEGELLGNLEYETDRTKFIGRDRTLANPRAVDFNQPLSNSVGAVLDPIMSLRSRVRVKAGQTVTVTFLTGVGEKKEAVLRLADKYRNSHTVNQAKDLAWSQNLMELTNLDLSFEAANLISSLASQVIFPGIMRQSINIKNNKLGQSALWAFGISGDLPIVLLKIQDNNQQKLVDLMLKIHEYWKIKGLFIDLVILNEDKTGYFQTIQDTIQEKVSISHVRLLVNKPGGVFLLKKDQLQSDVVLLLHTVSRLVFSGEYGSLPNQIRKLVRIAEQAPCPSGSHEQEKRLRPVLEKSTAKDNENLLNDLKDNLLFYNGYGGFSPDGKEYVIIATNQNNTPLPWVNVIGNPGFGTMVTEAGSSYTWSMNSREYKLTPWSNDPLLDSSGEALYLRDELTGIFWSPTPQPVKDQQPYIIRHGQGYSRIEHECTGLKQETTVYVPLGKNLKVVRLTLTNETNIVRQLSCYYYLEWVLGVNREQNMPFLVTETEENTLLCRNVYQEEFFERIAFLAVWGSAWLSCTGDRREFIGTNQNLSNPQGLYRDKLSGRTGHGLDPCGAIQVGVDLRPGEVKNLYFLVGDEADKQAALSLAKSFRSEEDLEQAYQEAVTYWDELLSTVQINTPEKSMDLLVNRWLSYQTLGCRIWARSAFYQSGGAIGYRDQLQDVMSLTLQRPQIARKQIVLHSSRQFPEGDVQHWWHPEKGKGIRTKFSDDLLWLPFVTADYLDHTGDFSVLEEETPFLKQDLLGENEDERYAIPEISTESTTVYEHCVRAIDRSLKFGEHGLPLIGTGDWNDGFSAVGREGKGESVWLGWFILTTLKAFLPVCSKMGDEPRVRKYQEVMEVLTDNMEKNGWDGAWYRRAYYDDGTPLGSITNTECQIDSLAQSWAVLSGFAKESRAVDGMLALEKYLWDKEENILKLFTPPFDKTEKNPGYIRGYIPGVRENGGQYTHGAIWAVLALAKLGERDKALELFNALNPINHSRTHHEVHKYKAEPYVMAADVYTVQNSVGRAGWTWYTGAAGWMYQTALKGILGFNLKENKLFLTPCVPHDWRGYTITYRYKTAEYTIKVELGLQERYILVDGKKQTEFPVELFDDGQKHLVKVFW